MPPKHTGPGSRQAELELKVGSQNRAFEYSGAKTSRYISGTSLNDRVSGLRGRLPATLMLTFPQKACLMYSCYRGGKSWVPSIPSDLAVMGEVLNTQITVPNQESFLKGIPTSTLANELGMRWMADIVKVHVRGFPGETRLQLTQSPPVNGVSAFEIVGETLGVVEFDKGSAYLDMQVKGAIGNSRTLRIYHDGRHPPRIGIHVGREFAPVFFVSSDGARLRYAYRDCRFNPHVATIYLMDPTTLYELGECVPWSIPERTEGISSAFRVNQVKFLRPFENLVQRVGTTYDVGRLGAEIALAIAKIKLGLADTAMVEPSQPGVDLFSPAGRTVIQARLLVQAHYLVSEEMDALVKKETADMLKSLRRDLKRIPGALMGHIILSLTSADWSTQTIVLSVSPQP